MKRDMELVRKILIILSEHQHGYAPRNFAVEGYTEEQVGYHCLLLGEAGLLEVVESSSMGEDSPNAIPVRLTWYGHEFIENAANEKIWSEAKQAINKVGDVSFSIWASVISNIVMHSLGIKV